MAQNSKDKTQDKKERIAKRMARAGLCSRRDAERWIEAGRVKVNGKVIDSPALNVGEGDKIIVDGKPLPETQDTRLFLYYKPAGLVTTHKDEKGRSTVFSQLPEYLPRVVSVGRLDLNTEGLLLLTNDGELARYLELPATGWTRQYRVRVFGQVDSKILEKLKKGVTVDGVRYAPITATIDSTEAKSGNANSWLSVSLKEGKNREIRRVMESLGLQVNRLIRTDYGPFSLGKMKLSEVKEINTVVMKAQIPKFFKTSGKSAGNKAQKQADRKKPHQKALGKPSRQKTKSSKS